MQPHVTVATLAVPLAAVSALLGLALLWQTRWHSRLQRTGRLGDESVLTFFSALLSVGNVVLLMCFLWMVVQSVRFGINPYLGTDPQICPPQPPMVRGILATPRRALFSQRPRCRRCGCCWWVPR